MTWNNGLRLLPQLTLGLRASWENFQQVFVIFRVIGRTCRQRATRRCRLLLFLLDEQKLKRIFVRRLLVRLPKSRSARCRLPSCVTLLAQFSQKPTKTLRMQLRRER